MIQEWINCNILFHLVTYLLLFLFSLVDEFQKTKISVRVKPVARYDWFKKPFKTYWSLNSHILKLLKRDFAPRNLCAKFCQNWSKRLINITQKQKFLLVLFTLIIIQRISSFSHSCLGVVPRVTIAAILVRNLPSAQYASGLALWRFCCVCALFALIF